MTQPIPTTKTRMIDGKQYRRMSETEFYTSKEEADRKVMEIEKNGYRNRSYDARVYEMSQSTNKDGKTTEIIIQYFIYIRVRR